MGLNFRLAKESDVWRLMELYQKVGSTFTNDELFLDFDKLNDSIKSAGSIWLIGEREGQIATTISILIDFEQALAKISRIIVNPALSSIQIDLRDSIRQTIRYLETLERKVEVLYCTTMTIPMQFQELTLEEGFKILGVFPNALGADSGRLNGLTAYYFKETLEKTRFKDFTLHPTLHPFFSISRANLNLPDLPLADLNQRNEVTPNSFPESLEIVDAPKLVAAKFDQLKKRRRNVMDFYPFYGPNLLITSADEEIQVFVKVIQASRFAAIVGEELLRSVNPAELYQAVVQLLKNRNVSYIEILNDAADTVGNQWILDASFVPCCYIPAFKKQTDTRRDYVVFCKTFEYVCRPDLSAKVPKSFLEFFKAFFKVEWSNYVG